MDQVKIALLRYGKMGQEIENVAKSKGIEVTDIFDMNNPLDESKEYSFDVAIDFTFPNSVMDNVNKLAKMKKNIVMGTTGWYNEKQTISDIIKENNIGFIWGSNFSVGMQMFFRIIEETAKLVNNTSDFDVMLHEMHHTRKKDSPGGSALSLANILLNNIERKSKLQTETVHGEIKPEELHLSSTRGGEITGKHIVYLDSLYDTIELSHSAKNRTGFASGSITAAEWIHNKQGFYEFNEVLTQLWGK